MSKKIICLLCVICLLPAAAFAAPTASAVAQIEGDSEVGDVFTLTVYLRDMSVESFLSCDFKINFDKNAAVAVDEDGNEARLLSDALIEKLPGVFTTYISTLSQTSFEVMCAGARAETNGSIALFSVRFKRVSDLPLYFSASAAAFLDDEFTPAVIDCGAFFTASGGTERKNLLTNGDFETISGSDITDWTVGAGSKGKASVQQMTTRNFTYNAEGDNHYITSTGANPDTNNSGAIKRYLQLEANKAYTVSYKVKSTYNGATMWFGPSLTDANGFEITTSNGYTAQQMREWRTVTNSLCPGKIDGDYSTITASDEWETRTRVLYTTDDYNLLLINMRWLSAGVSFDDFAVYEGATDSFSAIEIASAPTKTVYNIGEELDTAGLVVRGVGTEDALSDYTISGYDAQKIGAQEVFVTYNNLRTSFPVSVIANSLVAQCEADTISVRGSITEVKIAVPVYNPGEAKDATLLFCVYENEHLSYSSLLRTTLETGMNNAVLDEIVDGAISGKTVRVFVWDSLIRPLADSVNTLY